MHARRDSPRGGGGGGVVYQASQTASFNSTSSKRRFGLKVPCPPEIHSRTARERKGCQKLLVCFSKGVPKWRAVCRIDRDMGGSQELLHVHGAMQWRGAISYHLRAVGIDLLQGLQGLPFAPGPSTYCLSLLGSNQCSTLRSPYLGGKRMAFTTCC